MSSPAPDRMLSGDSGSHLEICDITIKTADNLKSVSVSIGDRFEEKVSWAAQPSNEKTWEFPPPYHSLLPSGRLTVRVRYAGIKLRRIIPQEISITTQDLLAQAADNAGQRQEWQRELDNVRITVGFTDGGTLRPTTDDIFLKCPRFRVLVIGKTGAGKSSLISQTFGITEAKSEHNTRGICNINKELFCPDENKRFVLHDSQGFEAGEDTNFKLVIDFLKLRKEMPTRDKVHAVWLCFPISTVGDRLFERGTEKFLEQLTQLGSMPVIAIFTKYDMLIRNVRFSEPFILRTQGLDDAALNTLLMQESEARLDASYIQPFKKVANENIPFIAVSTKEQHRDTLDRLAQLTADSVKRYLTGSEGEGVAIVSAAAQQVNSNVKIDAVIAIGKKRYWQGLSASASFSQRTLKACLQVLHMDIVNVWNVNDKDGLLESKEFKIIMMNIVSEQEESLSNPGAGLSAGLSVVAALAGILSALSGPAAPIVLPIAAAIVVGKWVYDVYEQSAVTLQRLMAYIVDLTLIMELIFGVVTSTNLVLSRRLIKLAYLAYKESDARNQTHREINNHVEDAQRADREGALKKVVELIQKGCLQSGEMRQQLAATLRNFENAGDEPWVTP